MIIINLLYLYSFFYFVWGHSRTFLVSLVALSLSNLEQSELSNQLQFLPQSTTQDEFRSLSSLLKSYNS